MNATNHAQRGFSAIEASIVLIVVVLLAALGYVYYNQTTGTSTTTTTTSATSNTIRSIIFVNMGMQFSISERIEYGESGDAFSKQYISSITES